MATFAKLVAAAVRMALGPVAAALLPQPLDPLAEWPATLGLLAPVLASERLTSSPSFCAVPDFGGGIVVD